MNADPPLTKDIPIDQIRPFISRARGKEGFDQLKASMRQYGLQIPVQVIDLGKRDADGKRYELICGEGRTEAARQLKWEKIPALIIEAPEVEIAGRFMAENLMRKSLPWAQKGKMVKELERSGLSMKEIANGLNISLGLAEKYRRILDKKGAEEVEAMPVNDAEVLTTLPARDQKIVMEVVKETGQNVKAIVEKAREVKKKKLRENPARQISLGKAVFVPRKNFLEPDQIRDLIAAAPDDSMRFVLFCGFHAGLRKLEITEARPDWFRLGSDSRRGILHVQPTDTYVPKDKEDRTIPLTVEFDAFLRGYLPSLPAGSRWAVYPAEKGKHAVYRVFIGQRFRAYMAAQGVRCTMHDMRRSFVSNKLIQNGTLIYKLAKWTGTDIRTLQNHYGHLLADDSDIEAGLGKM